MTQSSDSARGVHLDPKIGDLGAAQRKKQGNAGDTRERILNAAELGFSQGGFYGTSLSKVADAVGIKKPSLLHHFPSKEKLYGAVLERVALGLLHNLKQINNSGMDDKQRITTFLEGYYSWGRNDPQQAILLLREMLDNPARAATANNWYLTPFIEEAVAIIKCGQLNGTFKPVDPLAFIYNMIGAQHYFIVSLPTLKQILSARDYKDLLKQQRLNLIDIVQQQLFF